MHIVNQLTRNSGTVVVVSAEFSQDPDAAAITLVAER